MLITQIKGPIRVYRSNSLKNVYVTVIMTTFRNLLGLKGRT